MTYSLTLLDDSATFPVIIYAMPIMHKNKIVGIRGTAVDIPDISPNQEN
jgi:hypothetical protein